MFIKQFRSAWARVPDPLRPGKRTSEERLVPTGATSISHEDERYTADEAGWFDVPDHVGAHLLNFRHPGSERFYQPHDVSEDVRESLPAGSSQPTIDAIVVQAMQARIAELEAEAKAKAEADAKVEADAKAKAAAAAGAKAK
jgi:hypothetical protein